MNGDWFDKGRAIVIEQIAANSGLEISVVESVYAQLVNVGLIDYDIEKDVFWEAVEDEES